MKFIKCAKCGGTGIYSSHVHEEKTEIIQLTCILCGINYDMTSLMNNMSSLGSGCPKWVSVALRDWYEDLFNLGYSNKDLVNSVALEEE